VPSDAGYRRFIWERECSAKKGDSLKKSHKYYQGFALLDDFLNNNFCSGEFLFSW